MTKDIHIHVQQWLEMHSVRARAGLEAENGSVFDKAGLLPFLPESGEILVLRPVGAKPQLGPPPWQLCKGTRMMKDESGWRDIKGELSDGVQAESLAATALREAVEELGLLPEGIAQLFDLGPFSFASASTGKEKRMWLFASAMRERACMLPPDMVAVTTAARKWMQVEEFMNEGREDHVPIVLSARTMIQGMM